MGDLNLLARSQYLKIAGQIIKISDCVLRPAPSLQTHISTQHNIVELRVPELSEKELFL